jgi:5-methyltetrahydropteroyltriglutamate--homocysteine methyltransferase
MDELISQVFIRQYECTGPLVVKDTNPLIVDLRNLRSAAGKAGARDLFTMAASPGIVAGYIPNKYYPNHEAYLAALVDVLRPEYEAIVEAGYLLQLDCPDVSTPSVAERTLAVEAINAATAKIDPQHMRMHLCWGNGAGPHDTDVPLLDILPTVIKARPAAISFEGANPRHEHEWAVFDDFAFPEVRSTASRARSSKISFGACRPRT